jgi:beta-lactamase regulating signal transducer with metallopeptidase domain
VEEVVISAEPSVFVAGPPPVPSIPPERLPAPSVDWPRILILVWAIGVAILIGMTLLRVLCFRSLLKKAAPAPLELVRLLEELCLKLGVRRCPEVLLLPVRISPAVWSLSGRPRILLPAALAQDMNRDQLETILAHELAHIRRGDHLVRLLELAVTTLFWWNPVVWWVRRNLREMEEHCCDALVLETLPDSARRYAIALIETVEFLSNQSGRLPSGRRRPSPRSR